MSLRCPPSPCISAAELLVQALSTRKHDDGFAVFRREDDMVKQRSAGEGHGRPLTGTPAGVRITLIYTGGVAALHHRLQAMKPPASLEALQAPSIQVCDHVPLQM
jgi:hypothetical protein